MNPVELAKELEATAKAMLADALANDGSLVSGLYETAGRIRKAAFDLETALAVNALRRNAAGLRTSKPGVHARARRRAEELLRARGAPPGQPP